MPLLPSQSKVVWDEWTGTVWMRRESDAFSNNRELTKFYSFVDSSGDVRNVCIEEVRRAGYYPPVAV